MDELTIHLRNGVAYADIGADTHAVSRDPTVVNEIRQISESVLRGNEYGNEVVMSATCRAILFENEHVKVAERPYAAPPRNKETFHALENRRRNESRSNVNTRRSMRKFAPLEPASVFDVLAEAVSASDLTMNETGFVQMLRPAPSAGARHPIEVIVASAGPLVVNGSEIIRVGRYDPISCGIWELGSSESKRYLDAHSTAARSLGCAPPFLVILVARPWRTLSRYVNGSSYMFLDAGAQLAMLQLVACAHDLASCPISVSALGLEEPTPHVEASLPIVALALGAKV